MPKDWLDASGSEETANHALWLVRSDYGATITIDEIMLDENSRALVQQKGVESITALVQELHQDSGSYHISTPEKLRINGLDCVVFQQEKMATSEIRRIIIFSSRGRLYEANALASGGNNIEVFTVQQRLLETLKW